MEKTTAGMTEEYIKEHPDIKSCLKKGLINYSSLSRMVSRDLDISKKTSKEAVLIAARRFREKLREEASHEDEIRDIMARSEIEIKNRISLFIMEKMINLDYIDEIQRLVRKESGTFYIVEGSDNYTIITQNKYSGLIKNKLRLKIIKHADGLVLINLKSPKEIQQTIGVIYYLTSLFAENGVNIIEFMSCWTDTLFVIDSRDLNKAIGFLKF